MTNELIVRFVNEVCRSRIFKPRIAVCVPAQITGVEADAVVESVMGAGAKQVFLVDEPVAAALGAGLQIREPHGCMSWTSRAAPPTLPSSAWVAV